MDYDLVCILGATATGKTRLAVSLSKEKNGEIISADSRQVYISMDIGTGKDLDEYGDIPYHLIDIHPAGYKYNVFEFQQDFKIAFQEITKKGRLPILCGGSGLYLESVLTNYKMQAVPPNSKLREKLEKYSLEELVNILKGYKKLHNTTDTSTKKRIIRAIEIADYDKFNTSKCNSLDVPLKSLVIGIVYDVDQRRERITKRLKYRLDNGMIDEVNKLIKHGVTPEDLLYYGLEYKYIVLYISGKLTYNQMVEQLNTSIHRFAKRQMTWFRRMERNGISIKWIDGHLKDEDKLHQVLSIL